MRGEREILVHACCGPCSTASIERLLEEGWIPTILYTNSNIFPHEEFEKRWDNLVIVCGHYHIPLLREEQDHQAWLSFIKGLEQEKEGGARCRKCWEYNLQRTYRKAQEWGFSHFCTTLTVSRFKKSPLIFQVGSAFGLFEPIDFKKKDGFAKSCRLSQELGLYRQRYCGCEFSLHDSSVAPVYN